MRLFYCFLFFQTFAYGQADTLEILSWNTFLRPAILNDDQMNRVDEIAKFLDSTESEVLVLQEVFHRKARKDLISQLHDKYPFHTKRGRNSFFGVSSGVLILSKYPIEESSSVAYQKAKGSDALAKKGAVKVKIKLGERQIEIFGTHLQAGGGSEREEIRISQIEELSKFMQQREDSAIQIVAGDFNVSRVSPVFDSLTEILDTEMHKLQGDLKFTANFTDQNLFETSGNPKWIDFVLHREHDFLRVLEAEIFEPKVKTENGMVRISDHNPIALKVVIG